MKNIFKYLLPIVLIYFTTSCEEEKFLEEVPKDFYSPENSFIKPAHFESALADLYSKTRYINHSDKWESFAYYFGTDIFFSARRGNTSRAFDIYSTALDPTNNEHLIWHWEKWYKIVSGVNTIVSRLEESELSEEEKVQVEAEARFFRAWAYRHLVYLYGGVPIYTEEIKSKKTDFVRASREEVLQQIVSDAEFAAQNLKGIAELADGKISNLAAQQLLAETYISLGQYEKAVKAATVVIDDPNTALMTERFGSRADEEGDVFYDLFRRNNQNRSAGNTEAIWVLQMEYNVPGGLIGSIDRRNSYERWFGQVGWTCNDPDGNPGFLGQRSTMNVGGRGASLIEPSPYFENDLWESDFDNDMRNSSFNYHRTFYYDNPESAWFGMDAVANPGSIMSDPGQPWRYYPYITKITTPGNHPEEMYADPVLKTLISSAGATFTDFYNMRLAETYLLRAEAYLGLGNTGNAAADINVVRARANAKPVSAGEVDIDYILDERARELSIEEPRRITLQRLDKLVERVRKYNPLNADDIEDHHRVWPIPASEIQANIEAKLEQNAGYP